MSKPISTLCLCSALLMLGVGCSGHAGAPTDPSTPPGPATAVVIPALLHGVLHVPSPSSSGPQGRMTPWFVADDGRAYDLDLGPGFEPLSDPTSTGRGITITGEITLQFPVPVGAESHVITVTAFSFD